MSSDLALTGGCLCGRATYEIAGEPIAVAVCHCTNCQKQSGSAFSVNLLVAMTNLTLESDLASFSDISDDGNAVMRRFCPSCGSPVLSELTSTLGVVAIKAGTLDERSMIETTIQVWTRSKHHWLPDLEMARFETAPPKIA